MTMFFGDEITTFYPIYAKSMNIKYVDFDKKKFFLNIYAKLTDFTFR